MKQQSPKHVLYCGIKNILEKIITIFIFNRITKKHVTQYSKRNLTSENKKKMITAFSLLSLSN